MTSSSVSLVSRLHAAIVSQEFPEWERACPSAPELVVQVERQLDESKSSGDKSGKTVFWHLVKAGGIGNQERSNSPLAQASRLLEKAVVAEHTQDGVSVSHLTCWPRSYRAPALHLTWATLLGEGATIQVGAELLPMFLDEDDAVDWHRAVRRVCKQTGLDYEDAKQKADGAFRSAAPGGYRGIGGMQTFLNPSEAPGATSDGLLATILVPLLTAYLELVVCHDLETAFCADSQLTSSVNQPPVPTPLTPSELNWVASRRGHLSLALHAHNVPSVCLPPPPLSFGSASDGLPASVDVPRRARTLETALRVAPRPSYLETLFVQALRGASVPRPPVWLHRQAGRYLPEYREVKGDKGFLEMTGDPTIAKEITLQPVRRYGVDCAIIFSDIMTIPQALGMELLMQPGPFFPNPIRTKEDIDRLAYQPEALDHVYDALRLTREELSPDKALVGFCGAPWTLMAYMVGKDLAKKWLHMHPDWAHDLLSKCTEVAIDYLCKQLDAGANVVQVFESNAVDLGPLDFYEFAMPYLKKIAEGVKARHPHAPMTVFPRGANYATQRISQETLFDAISVDWAADPVEARKAAGEFVTMQGNLEPDVMYEPLESIAAKTRAMIRAFGKHRYIVNLGHGCKPDMSTEAVGAFIKEAQTIVLGSRHSPLAMAQAEIVRDSLAKVYVGVHNYRIEGVATKGDKILDVALAKIGDKGLFTKELEYAVMKGDVAVVQHSLKDLETTQPAELALGAVLKRSDKRDALVSRAEHQYTLETLPQGATVGTSSLRRRAQLACMRPDLRIVDVRGNLNTRIAKLLGTHPHTTEKYDALVLAVAGIERLPAVVQPSSGEPALVHVSPLDDASMVPAVSQGAIGVQACSRDRGILRMLAAIDDQESRVATAHERAFLRAIQGGCQVPVAVRVSRDVGSVTWTVEAHIWTLDGTTHLSTVASTGAEAAANLIKLGAADIVSSLRP